MTLAQYDSFLTVGKTEGAQSKAKSDNCLFFPSILWNTYYVQIFAIVQWQFDIMNTPKSC